MCGKRIFCLVRVLVLSLVITFCEKSEGKLTENDTNQSSAEHKPPNRIGGAGMALVFVEELKLMMERHVLGICPQNYKLQGLKAKSNNTATTCELDIDPHDLAGRLASLALRAHSAARSNECSRLASSLANAFGELARTAVQKQSLSNAGADAGKKRKLSKSQKAKIQAKQRTALAVKKKAAAVAAKQLAASVTS